MSAEGPAGQQRIAHAFAHSGKRAALMPYVMTGFPDREGALATARAYVGAGADLIEVGVPFSDPLADGPVIHAAATRALTQGTSVEDALELAGALAPSLAVVVMCYFNPILSRGLAEFVARLAADGVSGLIVPDLPLEEAGPMRAASDEAGVALVPLVAPTTTPERFEAIGAHARGFLYTVAVTGTTGERAALDGGLGGLVSRAKACTSVPVAVGFGISGPEQAAGAADAGADGVIVASRLIRAAGESDRPAEAAGEIVAAMAAALR